MADTVILVGTKRGLFRVSKNSNGKWSTSGPALAGENVNCAVADPRTGHLFAGSNSWHFGPSVVYSRDKGETWTRPEKQPRFPKDGPIAVEQIWQIAPLGKDKPGHLYCGVAPAALFESTDNGETWTENTALSSHPTRKDWQAGGGGLCLHTILVDPADSTHVLVGISAVGVFETRDGGKSWLLANDGLANAFQEEKGGCIGSCVHKIAFAADGKRIFQQNHMKAYRRDGDGPWQAINANLPSDFGFPLVTHPRDNDTAYVIPLKGGEYRAPVNGDLAVYRTTDAGASWHPLKSGLPSNSHVGILRDGFARDANTPFGLYFGTTGGHLYASADEGETWSLAVEHLPPIYSVHAATIGAE